MEKEQNASRLYQLVMEWKRVWGGQIEANFLWLSVRFQDLTSQEAYLDAEKERKLPKVVARYLEGHTRGILQVADDGMVDFLHRTAFDWLRAEENWSQLCSKGPPGYQSSVVLVAVLVSHIQSSNLDNSYTSWVMRIQYIHRVFMLAGEVPNTPEARTQLVPILDKLEPEHLRHLSSNDLFSETGVSIKSRTVDMNVVTLAAAWGCHAYLRGKLDSDPSVIKTQRGIIPFSSQPFVSVMEATIFGFRKSVAESASKDDSWFVEARRLSPWQASQRLETVKVLLEKNMKIQSPMKKSLKQLRDEAPDGSVESKYAQLLLDIAKHHGNLSSFEDMKKKVFSESMIRNSHAEWEFPEYQIK